MALNIGNNAVANAFVGSSQVRRAYKGGTLVYQGFGPASELEFIQKEATGGPAQLLKVYGKTIVWRQMMHGDNRTTTINGVTATNTDDLITLSGTCTLVGDATSISTGTRFTYTANHKYAVIPQVNGIAYGTQSVYWRIGGGVGIVPDGGMIFTKRASDYQVVLLYVYGGVNVDGVTARLVAIDLTDLYGSGYEPTSVAQFLALFPDALTAAYDAGSLQSNKTAELRAERIPVINVWNEDLLFNKGLGTNGAVVNAKGYQCSSLVPVVPSSTYFFHSPQKASYCCFYGEDGAYVSYRGYLPKDGEFTIPTNAYYLRFQLQRYGTTYNHDICINISNPAINGQYFPHWRGSLQLNLSTLTGKLNGEGASVVVYPDGLRGVGTDRDAAYGSTGEVARAVVDLGTLSWSKNSDPRGTYFWARIPNAKAVAGYLVTPNAICANYQAVSGANRANKTICQYNPDTSDEWMIYDSAYDSADAATFKAAMSGVMLDYPLATPLTYTLDMPLPTDLTCEQGDILQRVSDNNCPFVGEMRYAL